MPVYQEPKVSVIIPVYNVEPYLHQCLDSVINQTLRDIEIICVNDGSTDGSPLILEEYRANDPRIMIINQENLGNIHQKINEVLSGLEQEVLSSYLDGKSYQEIADSLGRHVKSIDNALQRVKRKLEKYLEENGRF